MAVKCIDVSDHQGKINWTKVKKAGVEVAIIRAGYGKNNTDSRWKENIEGAIKAGIKYIGVYWFSYAYSLTMAVNEADYCFNHLKPYKDHINFGVWFDWEYDSMRYAKKMKAACGKDRITAMTKAFCERIKSLGMVPGFYYNWDYKKNYYDLKQLPYYNWYALGKSNGEFKSVAIQQYGTESVPGIKGKVDANWVFQDVSKGTVPSDDKAASVSTKGIPNIPKRGYFKKGDSGKAVKWIQKKLNIANKTYNVKFEQFPDLKPLKVDGKWGDKTDRQLKIFQMVECIKKDGKAGVITLGRLENVKSSYIRGALTLAACIEFLDTYNYKNWSPSNKSTQYCPICHNQKGKYKGFNCICYISALFFHGAGAKIKCSGSGLGNNSQFTKDTEASWRKRNGNCWTEITNGGKKKGKSISVDKLRAGDILVCFNSKGEFIHIAVYLGHGMYGDCTSRRHKPGRDKYSKLTSLYHVTRAYRYTK